MTLRCGDLHGDHPCTLGLTNGQMRGFQVWRVALELRSVGGPRPLVLGALLEEQPPVSVEERVEAAVQGCRYAGNCRRLASTLLPLLGSEQRSGPLQALCALEGAPDPGRLMVEVMAKREVTVDGFRVSSSDILGLIGEGYPVSREVADEVRTRAPRWVERRLLDVDLQVATAANSGCPAVLSALGKALREEDTELRGRVLRGLTGLVIRKGCRDVSTAVPKGLEPWAAALAKELEGRDHPGSLRRVVAAAEEELRRAGFRLTWIASSSEAVLSMRGRIQGAGGLLALLALLSLPGVAGGPGGKEPATPSERRLSQALLLPGDDRDDAVTEAIRSGLSPETTSDIGSLVPGDSAFASALSASGLADRREPGLVQPPRPAGPCGIRRRERSGEERSVRRALREGSARWGRERVVRRLDAIQSVCLGGIAELEDDLIQVFDRRDPEAPRWLNRFVQMEVLRLCTGMSSGFANVAAELRRRGSEVMVCVREDGSGAWEMDSAKLFSTPECRRPVTVGGLSRAMSGVQLLEADKVGTTGP